MTDSETLWKEIAASALIGTLRKPFTPANAGGSLGHLLNVVAANAAPPAGNPSSGTTGERLLLLAAVVTNLHRKAGQIPPVGTAQFPVPCPPDEWPRCSPQAGRFLEEILSAGNGLLLKEWIEIATRLRQRVREEHLPLLLEQQKRIQPLRLALLPVLGERGRWLAAQNPEWRSFAGNQEERSWHEGERKERLLYLTSLRARDPRRAIELLAETWPQEAPAERVVFLEALRENLSLEDEPFLESTLSDRRRDVRQTAADCLARLPASQFVRRWTERVRRLLSWKSGLLRSTLEVTLPDQCDEGMLRDGIEPRPPSNQKLGEKAWWLVQMLGLAPPRTWTAAWNKRPGQILDVIRKSEWEEVLLNGWTEAALRFDDLEWLEAIISHEARRDQAQRLFQIFPRFPDALKEKLLVDLLRENPSLSYEQPASIYLSACRHPWSIELTQAAVTCICWSLHRGDMQAWRWEKLLRDIAPYIYAGLLDSAIDRVATSLKKKEGGDPSVNNLLSLLQFRLDMRRAFQP